MEPNRANRESVKVAAMNPFLFDADTPGATARLRRFLARPAFDPKAEDTARRVLENIRRRGLAAVLEAVRRFDGVTLTARQLAVSRRDIFHARRHVSPAFRRAVRLAAQRIFAFSRAGMRRNWAIRTPNGGWIGERFVPLDRVGVYVPGGYAPLASTALMTATLARAAGVRDIVACTPTDARGRIHPALLYALSVAGATEIYRVGGIQAIGLMAYGTSSIPPVQKIAGPGGVFVTAAKRLVYGHVALDLVAGPSEIAVLADRYADPALVAADLLAQAEHGTGWEKLFLVTDSRPFAEACWRECERQADTLPRRDAIRKVLKRGTLFLVVRRLAEGLEWINRFAPEHVELHVRHPSQWLSRIRCAGAVFLGCWTPESAGDFVAGPSHVLPTGGAASRFSGLTVDDFRRRLSVVRFTRADLRHTLSAIEAFAAVEGLEAHGRSARMRFWRAGGADNGVTGWAEGDRRA